MARRRADIGRIYALYLAAVYQGHTFTPWTSVAFGTVSVLGLTPTAAAHFLSPSRG